MAYENMLDPNDDRIQSVLDLHNYENDNDRARAAEAISIYQHRHGGVDQTLVDALTTVQGAAKHLVRMSIDGGLTDDLLAQVFPEAKKKNMQPADKFAKDARRAINEMRQAIAVGEAALALVEKPKE